jgi:putative PIN family toxin of toxin-antitoxin system
MSQHVVIDTSILISALIGAQGPSREILRQCFKGSYKPLISNSLFAEYEDVSSRKQIVELCPVTDVERRKLLNAFYKICQWVSIHYLWRPNIKDEGDNFLIELAAAGNADFLVTNNIKDFKNMQLKFPSIQIVTPEQLLRGDYDVNTNH